MQKYIGDNNRKKIHSDVFPDTFRMLIVGPSSCGKTILLMKLLLEDGLLNYDKLFIFARSLYQHQYQCLRIGLENNLPKSDIIELINSTKLTKKHDASLDDIAKSISEINLEDEKEPSEIECEFHETSDDIPDPCDVDRGIKNLIVFDDIMTDRKQNKPESYYTRGRSANCDCIYLAQNYTHLPLHTIRSNSNFMIFFKASPMVVEQLYRNFSSVDMELKDWKQMCKTAWSKKYGYIVIDLSRDYESGNKYRFNIELN